MSDAPPARLLDITRLVSRAGRVLTGVDRVELAYVQALLADAVPVFGLCRTAIGYVLLDHAGLAAFANAVMRNEWPSPDILSRLSFRATLADKRGQTFMRAHCCARCIPRKLSAMLQAALPVGVSYLNVGHSNLTDRVMKAVRAIPNSRITIMVHDTIPLDLPDMQRAGTVAVFAGKLRRVSADADLVICPSVASVRDVTRHMQTMGRIPPIIPAHLGVPVPEPDAGALPNHIDLSRPYFVCTGTIEPRKNHALLLDVWDNWGADAPTLFICGRRGWRNADVFARLDRGIPHVVELPDLSDGALAALTQGARALLFPSLAEGFGLPPVEAAALGTRVVCADLAVCREILGKTPVYLAATDRYLWENMIKKLTTDSDRQVTQRFMPQNWATHFKIVLTMA